MLYEENNILKIVFNHKKSFFLLLDLELDCIALMCYRAHSDFDYVLSIPPFCFISLYQKLANFWGALCIASCSHS